MQRGLRVENNPIDESCNFKITNDDVFIKCECNTNCKPTLDNWCNTIVYDIYKNDKLDELPVKILEQMILAIKDKKRGV